MFIGPQQHVLRPASQPRQTQIHALLELRSLQNQRLGLRRLLDPSATKPLLFPLQIDFLELNRVPVVLRLGVDQVPVPMQVDRLRKVCPLVLVEVHHFLDALPLPAELIRSFQAEVQIVEVA